MKGVLMVSKGSKEMYFRGLEECEVDTFDFIGYSNGKEEVNHLIVTYKANNDIVKALVDGDECVYEIEKNGEWLEWSINRKDYSDKQDGIVITIHEKDSGMIDDLLYSDEGTNITQLFIMSEDTTMKHTVQAFCDQASFDRIRELMR